MSSTKPISSISSASSSTNRTDGREVEGPAADVVHDAAWSPDDDLGAGAQASELPVVGLAAVHREHRQAARAPEAVHRLRHLHGELARRGEHQRLHRSPLRVDALDDGERERGRFTGTRPRLRQHVPPLEQQRDRLRLDRRRLLVAECFDRAQDLGAQVEVSELGRCPGLSVHHQTNCRSAHCFPSVRPARAAAAVRAESRSQGAVLGGLHYVYDWAACGRECSRPHRMAPRTFARGPSVASRQRMGEARARDRVSARAVRVPEQAFRGSVRSRTMGLRMRAIYSSSPCRQTRKRVRRGPWWRPISRRCLSSDRDDESAAASAAWWMGGSGAR